MKKSFNNMSSSCVRVCMFVLALLFSAIFISCSQDDDGTTAQDFDISEIYGYTYSGTITASSGTTLTPAIIIYNDERCDWNMSTNNMSNNQFYYYSEKTGTGAYTLYWFGSDKKSYCYQKDSSEADMTVQLGINSLDQVVILLTADDYSGVSNMTNTRVTMNLQTSTAKNVNPSEISDDEDIQDVTITIPESAAAATWSGESSYSGTFVYLVGDDGSIEKGSGSCGTDSSGNEIMPTVSFSDSASGSITIKMHIFCYNSSMTIESYEVSDISVKEADGVQYLEYSGTVTTGSYTLNSFSLAGKLEDGNLTLRVSFKPGAMPFAITEVFTSESE